MISQLYEKQKHTDVIFRSNDDLTFTAHKFIVVTQSEYFDKLFSDETKNETSTISIPANGVVVKALLDWMYLGNIQNTENLSVIGLMDLFHLSTEYKIEQLTVL